MKSPAFQFLDVTYSIVDWDVHFENSESRKYKSLKWVPFPNKQDGSTYRRVAAHPKSVQIFCAWTLIVEVASKMPTRGVLHDGNRAITALDFHFKTGFPKHIFEVAFEALAAKEIGWLKCESAEISEDVRRKPVEQNRIEQNRTIGRSSPSPLVELQDSEEFEAAWTMWLEHLEQKRKRPTIHAMDLQLRELAGFGVKRAIAAIQHSIKKSYQGIYEPNSNNGGASAKRTDRNQNTANDGKASQYEGVGKVGKV